MDRGEGGGVNVLLSPTLPIPSLHDVLGVSVAASVVLGPSFPARVGSSFALDVVAEIPKWIGTYVFDLE